MEMRMCVRVRVYEYRFLMIIFIDQFQSELSVSAILSCEETNISLEFKDRWSKVFREEVKIIKDNWIAILLSNIFYFHFQKNTILL